MAVVRQQRRHIGGHHMYKSGKGKKHPGSSMKWLTTTFYCVLFVMVVHLIFSEGDPKQVRPGNENGKTTSRLRPQSGTSFDASYSHKKLPSYRQSENSHHVEEIGAADLNFYIHDQNDNINSMPGDIGKQFEHITNDGDGLIPAGDEKEEQHQRAFDEKKRSQKESEDAKESVSTEENAESQEEGAEEVTKDAAEKEGNAEKDKEDPNEKESDESDVIENMKGLKASVEDAMKNLRSAADAKMGPISDQLRDDIEQYKSQIGNSLSAINKQFFASLDMSLKVEEMVFDVIVDNTITSFQEQVSLLLADSSEALDKLVADAEERDMGVLEIDKEIMEYESSRKAELEGEIDTTIANGVRDGFKYSIPAIAKETMTMLFAKMGYPAASWTTDSYERLVLEESPNSPVKGSFTAEQAEAAISAISREGIDLKGKDDADAVATRDDEEEEENDTEEEEADEEEEEEAETEGIVDDGEADDKGSTSEEGGNNEVAETEPVQESIVTEAAEYEGHHNATRGASGNSTALEGGNDVELDEQEGTSKAEGGHNATGGTNATHVGDHADLVAMEEHAEAEDKTKAAGDKNATEKGDAKEGNDDMFGPVVAFATREQAENETASSLEKEAAKQAEEKIAATSDSATPAEQETPALRDESAKPSEKVVEKESPPSAEEKTIEPPVEESAIPAGQDTPKIATKKEAFTLADEGAAKVPEAEATKAPEKSAAEATKAPEKPAAEATKAPKKRYDVGATLAPKKPVAVPKGGESSKETKAPKKLSATDVASSQAETKTETAKRATEEKFAEKVAAKEAAAAKKEAKAEKAAAKEAAKAEKAAAKEASAAKKEAKAEKAAAKEAAAAKKEAKAEKGEAAPSISSEQKATAQAAKAEKAEAAAAAKPDKLKAATAVAPTDAKKNIGKDTDKKAEKEI